MVGITTSKMMASAPAAAAGEAGVPKDVGVEKVEVLARQSLDLGQRVLDHLGVVALAAGEE